MNNFRIGFPSETACLCDCILGIAGAELPSRSRHCTVSCHQICNQIGKAELEASCLQWGWERPTAHIIKDMSFNVTLHLSYKFRLLLLFTLCLTVVGWATSNYFVGAIQEISKAKDLMASLNKGVVLGKKRTVTEEASVKKADLNNCSSVSPHLSKYLFFLFNK